MSIVVERLVKSYEDHLVVNQVTFEVAEGACFVLLGPSGSGKSTVLRILAGLVEPDSGRVLLHGNDVTRLPPQRRGVGMVFQHYALFGHMTVADNVEFALRIRRTAARERRRRRDELLELVGLIGFESRYPHQLSGGQQQRVALARALAHRPEVLVLDEPFGALDARIRVELRRTLKAIQRELAVTTLFVTHDQEEAFDLADHLGVMDFGRLLETGPPDELYLRPKTEFVAAFLGKANLVAAECTNDVVMLGDVRLPLGTKDDNVAGTSRVQVLFRPEDVAVKVTQEALEWPELGRGVVEEVEFSGSQERLRIRLPRLKGSRPISPQVPFGSDHMFIEATRSQHLARRFPLHPGDAAWVGIRRVHALTHAGLSFLLRDDGTASAAATLAYAGDLARLCHARVAVLVPGEGDPADSKRAQELREILGSGLARLDFRPASETTVEEVARQSERHPSDLLILDRPRRDPAAVVRVLLSHGEHHVLLVPDKLPQPRNALVCVAAGESGKTGVLFAGRLLRHLKAAATVLSVVPEEMGDVVPLVERFHTAALRSLTLLGVEGTSHIAQGLPRDVIPHRLREGGHDLLVLGTSSLLRPDNPDLGRLLRDLLVAVTDVPILLVRSKRNP